MKPKKWKVISKNLILDHSLLKISEDKIELLNGKTTTYVRHAPSDNDSVIMIALSDDNEILIQREYSYPPDKIMYQLPGGSMKPDESIEAAANRELSEESGYGSKITEIIGYFYVQNRLSDKKQHVVLCRDLYINKQKEDYDEFIESLWMTKKQLKTMINRGKFDNINLLAALNLWFNR